MQYQDNAMKTFKAKSRRVSQEYNFEFHGKKFLVFIAFLLFFKSK